MAARSIASLSLSFGLVSIPVKVYSATESKSGVSFNLLHECGSRVRQQYVCIKEGVPVERSQLMKGYEFEKDRYVMFEPEELKALEDTGQHTVDIISFIPLSSVDPIYYDKAYYLAPDKRGGKPYGLLLEAMRESGRCALARWVWKGKQYVVQVRPGQDGLILQQLLYSDEVRSMKDLDIETTEIRKPELQLALQLIDQISVDSYDPTEFKDEEKQRVLAAIDEKIAGKQIVVTETQEPASGQIIDLTEALRASLSKGKRQAKPVAAERGATPRAGGSAGAGRSAGSGQAADLAPAAAGSAPEPAQNPAAKGRKAPKRAAVPDTPARVAEAAPRARARK